MPLLSRIYAEHNTESSEYESVDDGLVSTDSSSTTENEGDAVDDLGSAVHLVTNPAVLDNLQSTPYLLCSQGAAERSTLISQD